ncbi:hypothetical protein F4775DRAFT_342475 [Biscogniauxia sp. FL1348]|nr:hypothetical protein F4775DRAFT_342475 [Biscogniauxia sp. FL1348]
MVLSLSLSPSLSLCLWTGRSRRADLRLVENLQAFRVTDSATVCLGRRVLAMVPWFFSESTNSEMPDKQERSTNAASIVCLIISCVSGVCDTAQLPAPTHTVSPSMGQGSVPATATSDAAEAASAIGAMISDLDPITASTLTGKRGFNTPWQNDTSSRIISAWPVSARRNSDDEIASRQAITRAWAGQWRVIPVNKGRGFSQVHARPLGFSFLICRYVLAEPVKCAQNSIECMYTSHACMYICMHVCRCI